MVSFRAPPFHGAGIGLRLPHLVELVATRPAVGWLDIHPETFLANPHATELLLDPAVAARVATVQEITIPILLFLDLATRVATLPLLGMIAVIQTSVYPNAYNEHLAWGSILVLLLTRGPGVFSVDYLIDRQSKRRSSSRSRSVSRGAAA